MRILIKMLKQQAVYWAPAGLDKFGKMTFAIPVQIKCRWEDCNEQFIDRNGKQQTSAAKVYVDRDVQTLGVLWLGKLSDLSAIQIANPFKTEKAGQIQKFDKLPTLKAKQFLRTAFL